MNDNCGTTVMEFVKSDSGTDDRARVTRRRTEVARIDAVPVEALAGVPGGGSEMAGQARSGTARRDGAPTLSAPGEMAEGAGRRDDPDRRGAGPGDELDAGLTPEQMAAERAAARQALRRLHVPVGDVCDWCRQPFPCPDSRG